MQTYVFALTPGCTRIAHAIYCQSYVGAKSVPAWSLLDQLQVLMPDGSEKCLSGLAWPSGFSSVDHEASEGKTVESGYRRPAPFVIIFPR
jgi:hypothetical protein